MNELIEDTILSEEEDTLLEDALLLDKKIENNPIKYTHNGVKLKYEEERFIENILDGKNLVEAYLDIEPLSKSPYKDAVKLYNKKYIKSEIAYRTGKNIADDTEILAFFTSVMRGEIDDAFGLEASLADRTVAAKELAKRQIDMVEKNANNSGGSMKIVLDWKRDKN